MSARPPSRFARSHLPALAWVVFTSIALAAPGDALPQWSDEVWLGPWLDPVLDKVLHFILFAILAALAARSFRALDPEGRGRTLARRPLLAAVLASVAYGALSELAQLWSTTRTAEPADFGADVAGALCAAGLMWTVRRRKAAGTGAASPTGVTPRTSR